jgi:hypothetical protein
MKTLPVTLVVSAVGLALALASPAEAAKSGKHKNAGVPHAAKQRQAAAVVHAAGPGFTAGVMAGPLYNGQDYIGDDPDPNVRAYLLRDMTRYRGSY